MLWHYITNFLFMLAKKSNINIKTKYFYHVFLFESNIYKYLFYYKHRNKNN
jgi:hypothetical protein